MGGGDLNLKKSWHPHTLKNQKRVYEAEQANAAEKRKLAELQREIQNERNFEEMKKFGQNSGVLAADDSKRLEWMYKGAENALNREEYLTGRNIDKHFEQQDKIEREKEVSAMIGVSVPKNHVEHECIPFSIRAFSGAPKTEDQVDIQRKIMEDPLMLIQQREIQTRQKLLQNPVKLKEIHRLLQADKKLRDSSSKKKKSKKSKKKRDSDSEDDLDSQLAKKYKQLVGEKAGAVNIDKLLNEKYEKLTSELDKIKDSKKKEKKSKSKKKKSDRSSSDESDDARRKKGRENRDTSRNRERNGRNQSPPRNRRRSKSPVRHREHFSRDIERSKRRSRTPPLPKRDRHNDREKRRDRSRSNGRDQPKDSRDRQREKQNDRQVDRNRDNDQHRRPERRPRNRSPIRDRRNRSRSGNTAMNNRDSSRNRSGRDRKRSKSPSPRRKRPSRSRSRSVNRRANRVPQNRTKTPEKLAWVGHESIAEKPAERAVPSAALPPNKSSPSSSSDSSSDSDADSHNDDKHRPPPKNFGLVTAGGEKIEIDKSSHAKAKPVEVKKPTATYVPPQPRPKLTDEEKEARLREMAQNAEWHDKEQTMSRKRHEERTRKEAEQEKTLEFDRNYIHKEMHKALSNQDSVEARLKSNKNHIQRMSSSMHSHFAKK